MRAVLSEGGGRFIRGILSRTNDGRLLLSTATGAAPVKVEGASIPLGQEVILELLRREPGRLILTPLKPESWEEALPFLRELPSTDDLTWESFIKAAIDEGLPLEKEILLSLRRWSLIAEKDWGVKVNPRAFAFLLAKEIPIGPTTLLWALYTRFPAVRREVWSQVYSEFLGEKGLPSDLEGEGLIKSAFDLISRLLIKDPLLGADEAKQSELGSDEAKQSELGSDEAKQSELGSDEAKQSPPSLEKGSLEEGSRPRSEAEDPSNKERSVTGERKEVWMETLRGGSRFLARQAGTEESLPELAFHIFPHPDQEVRWEGRATPGEEEERGYSFRLSFYSEILHKTEVIGVQDQEGLELMVGVETSPETFQPYIADLQEHLKSKGWKIKRMRFFSLLQREKTEKILPPRIDGWV